MKWADTKLEGDLKLVKVTEVDGVPIINVRLCNAIETILEYELPINFTYSPHLSKKFSALKIIEG